MYEVRCSRSSSCPACAPISSFDAHRIVVSGPKKRSRGRALDSRDLRSGMASSPPRWPRGATRWTRSRRSSAATPTSSRRLKSLGAAVRSRTQLAANRRAEALRLLRRPVGRRRRWRHAGGRVVGWLVGGWIWPGGRPASCPPEDAACGLASSSSAARPAAAAAAGATVARRPPLESRPTRNGPGPRRRGRATRTIRGSTSARCRSARLFPRMAEQPADDREVTDPAIPSSVVRSSSRIRAGEHVRLAVAEADGRLYVARAERRSF